jgi:hypothetical protein
VSEVRCFCFDIMLIYLVARKQFGIVLTNFKTDIEIIKKNMNWNSDSRKKGNNKYLKISVWGIFKLNFIGVRTGNTM